MNNAHCSIYVHWTYNCKISQDVQFDFKDQFNNVSVRWGLPSCNDILYCCGQYWYLVLLTKEQWVVHNTKAKVRRSMKRDCIHFQQILKALKFKFELDSNVFLSWFLEWFNMWLDIRFLMRKKSMCTIEAEITTIYYILCSSNHIENQKICVYSF